MRFAVILSLLSLLPQDSEGLVAHFTLDDDSCLDETGHCKPGHARGVTVVDGKIGKGLRFDGRGCIRISNNDTLKKIQEGSYSISVWFKPAQTPDGEGAAATANYGIVIKKGFHEGLVFNAANQFVMCHWLAKGLRPLMAGSTEGFPPGVFYHVVGVVDLKEGEVRLYVDGELINTAAIDTDDKAADFKHECWRIGTALSDPEAKTAWPCKGVIDDVRFYNRALSDSEVIKLFKKR